MLNNIFINENSLNKFSARNKQTDPTMALDQASSFAGALANQVSINQNNSSSSTSSSAPTNSGSTSSHSNDQNKNNVQQANQSVNNNETTKVENQNINQGTNNKASENTQARANSQTASSANNNNAKDNTVQSKTTEQTQIKGITINKKIDLNNNILGSVNNTNKELGLQNIKDSALPENFQKIIANLQNRNTKQNLNTDTKQNVVNKAEPSTDEANLVTDKRPTDNKALSQHQIDLRAKSRLSLNNARNNTSINTRPVQETLNINPRESTLSNDKAFVINQTQIKNLDNNNILINNLENQNDINKQHQASNTATNNNPMFGLSNVSATSVTSSNANLQQGIINTHINNPQWGNDLSRQMTNMIRIAGNGIQTAELRLDPPELGPLRVTINLNDGVVNAVFSSMHANVRNAIEQSLPQLQQQLQQEGLSLGQADVGQDNQDSQHAQNNNNTKGDTFLTQNQENTNTDINMVQSNERYIDPNALLDTYV